MLYSPHQTHPSRKGRVDSAVGKGFADGYLLKQAEQHLLEAGGQKGVVIKKIGNPLKPFGREIGMESSWRTDYTYKLNQKLQGIISFSFKGFHLLKDGQ